jgi:hypothetical protein
LVGEKDAFFSREDDLGRLTREYPVDDQTGRIVGEVHLDHVPVDFLKQKFERGGEWSSAMEYVRGKSLMPSQWADGYVNESPVSKLNHAYKRIREFGRKSMYMGVWDSTRKRAVRISREIERDYYERFLAREPGYYDDAEWWKHVEGADTPPPPLRVECEECNFQNLLDAAECEGCGCLLLSKPCISCGVEIPLLAASCPDCGVDQELEIPEPWECVYCKHSNSAEDLGCGECGLSKVGDHPTSREALLRSARPEAELTKTGWTVVLANGVRSDPLDLRVWTCPSDLRPEWGSPPVPLVPFKEPGLVELFIDPTHPAFGDLQVKPVELVAAEAAQYLYTHNSHLTGRAGHSLSALVACILDELWGEDLSAGHEVVKVRITELFTEVAERLSGRPEAADFYSDMRDDRKEELHKALHDARRLNDIAELTKAGGYLTYLPWKYLVDFFGRSTDAWLEEVWSIDLPGADLVGEAMARRERQNEFSHISRCLGDCAALFEAADPPRSEIVSRAHSALESLEARLR